MSSNFAKLIFSFTSSKGILCSIKIRRIFSLAAVSLTIQVKRNVRSQNKSFPFVLTKEGKNESRISNDVLGGIN